MARYCQPHGIARARNSWIDTSSEAAIRSDPPGYAARRSGFAAAGAATTSAFRSVTDSNAGPAPNSVRGRTGVGPGRGPDGGRTGAGRGPDSRPRAAMGSGPH